jgi:capsule polysaccharide export protein KpsE/RkpR
VHFLKVHGFAQTITGIDGIDWQILLEADFLVNSLEENMSSDTIQSAYDKVFKTAAGKRFCEKLYCIN